MSQRLKILIGDYYYKEDDGDQAILARLDNVEIVDGTTIKPGGLLDEESLIEHVGDVDALIVQFGRVTERVISTMKRCRIIARYAIGVDNIDVAAATRAGIVVSNVPDYCIEEVSNTAMAYILGSHRRVGFAHELRRRHAFDYAALGTVRRFTELTVGLLAYGNIGRRVAEKLEPFGCRIIAYDPVYNKKTAIAEPVSFRELFEQSDILSVHAPLNEETYHLVGPTEFASMKLGAIMVNTSRGGIVDERALLEAVKDGRIAVAGLDVIENEAEYATTPLGADERIVMTPHSAWFSEEARRELRTKTSLNVFHMLKDGKPLYSVIEETG